MIVIIAAINKYGTLGLNGDMPWRNREDLHHFRKTTLHKTLIMGRKTVESIPTPLKDRVVLEVSGSKPDSDIKNLKEYLETITKSDETFFIAGGGEIYRESIKYADYMILSIIPDDTIGDTFFPDFSLKEFEIVKRVPHQTFEEIHYKRRK